MNKIRLYQIKLLRLFKNIYFITTISFVLWMIFFDSNSLMNQQTLKQKIKELEEEKVYYDKQIQEIQEDMRELNSDPVELEKFARENYQFKRPGEDVYLIKEDQ